MLLKLIRSAFRRERPVHELDALALEHYERGDLSAAERYWQEVALRNADDARIWRNYAVALLRQQKHAEALPVLRRVTELEPDLAEAHFDLGTCFNRLRKNTEAILHLQRAIELKPMLHKAHAQLVNAYMDCCDWAAIERWTAEFEDFRASHPREEWAERVEPFCALTLFPGETHKQVAVHYAEAARRGVEPVKRDGARAATGKIRVGYVSADFHDHATAHLTSALYGAHDRSRFEVVAYSTGPDDGSTYRRHIERTCDRFFDVRNETPGHTAERIARDGIDVLVDMKGHTSGARPAIFAHRPAPVQVGYLGYPGTTGAPYIDYFISDPVATPRGGESEFTERVVRLPDSYQVNDRGQAIPEASVTRAGCGLPPDAFVYCSFNALRKIDQVIFSTWMAILERVPRGVLWLSAGDPVAEASLRHAAAARGVDPRRLVFAPQEKKPDHLARHRLADFFVDTYVCNAHTGASDAMWAGLPLVTCPGKTFIARVAASVVTAAGLPELITPDLGAYEALAVRLAENREMLRGVKAKLETQRLSCALFDTSRYVKNLESAFVRMHDLAMRGEVTQSFEV